MKDVGRVMRGMKLRMVGGCDEGRKGIGMKDGRG